MLIFSYWKRDISTLKMQCRLTFYQQVVCIWQENFAMCSQENNTNDSAARLRTHLALFSYTLIPCFEKMPHKRAIVDMHGKQRRNGLLFDPLANLHIVKHCLCTFVDAYSTKKNETAPFLFSCVLYTLGSLNISFEWRKTAPSHPSRCWCCYCKDFEQNFLFCLFKAQMEINKHLIALVFGHFQWFSSINFSHTG